VDQERRLPGLISAFSATPASRGAGLGVEPRCAWVAGTGLLSFAYRDGPAARWVVALRAAGGGRPGHHRGALDWARNGGLSRRPRRGRGGPAVRPAASHQAL